MFRKNKLLFISIFIAGVSFCQELHHEMKGAQGGTVKLTNNHIVRYSVGQQTITGTYDSHVIVQQGFQQKFIKNSFKSNNELVKIQAIAFPNPFVDAVQINFSENPGPIISVTVFDLLGRVVHNKEFQNFDNKINLNLKELASAEYIVTFTSLNLIDSINLIKL